MLLVVLLPLVKIKKEALLTSYVVATCLKVGCFLLSCLYAWDDDDDEIYAQSVLVVRYYK